MAKLNLTSGENSTLVGKRGKTYGGLRVRLIPQHTTANTALANTDVDPSKVRLKVTLNRRGKAVDICNERLDVLAMDSSFMDSHFDFIQPGSTTHVKLVVAAAGVKEVAMIPLEVDFGGPINLRGDDELEVEVFPQSGVYGANCDQTNSRIEVDWIEAVGVEYYIPQISTKFLKPSETDVEEHCGDNVMSVRLINTDKTAVTEATTVVDNITVQTDRLSATRDYRDLMHERLTQFGNVVDAQKRYQSFELLKGTDFDSVSVKLKLDSSNVAASKTCLVIRRFSTDAQTIDLANATRRKHEAANLRKYGYQLHDTWSNERSQIIKNHR